MKKLILMSLLLLSACYKPTGNPSFYQEDYDGNCFRPQVTWSEMSACLVNDRNKEWEQNHLTNELAKK